MPIQYRITNQPPSRFIYKCRVSKLCYNSTNYLIYSLCNVGLYDGGVVAVWRQRWRQRRRCSMSGLDLLISMLRSVTRVHIFA